MGNEDFALVKERVKIEDYAEYLGMHLIPRGRILTTKEHDSLIIRPDRGLFYRNSTQHGGTIIDFVMEFTEYDTPAKAVKHLLEFSGMTGQAGKEVKTKRRTDVKTGSTKNDKPKIILPSHADDNKRVFAYLNKTRGISASVIGHMIKHGYLYQDTRNNCVFVGFDDNGQVCYGMLRSTFSDGTFKGDLKGCDYDKGMLVSHDADILVVTEAAIDAMSYMDLITLSGGNYKDHDYLILGSATKWKALEYRLDNHRYAEIILALDNDEAGRLGNSKMTELLKDRGFSGKISIDIPHNKDWNEDLTKRT